MIFDLRSAAVAATLTLACPIVTVAQTYQDRLGTIIPGVTEVPFPFIPLSPGQHNIAPTSPTGLAVPTGARYAVVCASGSSGNTVRYTTDGTTTPTTSFGMPLVAGNCVPLYGPQVIANFRAFSSTATLDVEYYQ